LNGGMATARLPRGTVKRREERGVRCGGLQLGALAFVVRPQVNQGEIKWTRKQ
jgi:hypothetical protein